MVFGNFARSSIYYETEGEIFMLKKKMFAALLSLVLVLGLLPAVTALADNTSPDTPQRLGCYKLIKTYLSNTWES